MMRQAPGRLPVKEATVSAAAVGAHTMTKSEGRQQQVACTVPLPVENANRGRSQFSCQCNRRENEPRRASSALPMCESTGSPVAAADQLAQ